MDNNFEELVEFYNELLEDTRWKQAVRAGELSGKAVATLRKKNIIPKQRRMLRGLETGARKIRHKHGASQIHVGSGTTTTKHEINKAIDKTFGKKNTGLVGFFKKKVARDMDKRVNSLDQNNFYRTDYHVFMAAKPKTVAPKSGNDSTTKRFKHAVFNKHEADEVASIPKVTSGRSRQLVTDIKNPNIKQRIVQRVKPETYRGRHNSTSVLKSERKTTDFLKNAYGKNTDAAKSAREIEQARKSRTVLGTGGKSEYDFIGDKKAVRKYNRVQKNMNRKYKRQEKALRAARNKERAKKAAASESFYLINDVINNFILHG